jgi:hypothetical protein
MMLRVLENHHAINRQRPSAVSILIVACLALDAVFAIVMIVGGLR